MAEYDFNGYLEETDCKRFNALFGGFPSAAPKYRKFAILPMAE